MKNSTAGWPARIALAFLAVVAMMVAMTGCSSDDSAAADMKVGQCYAELPGNGRSGVDCGDAQAVYKVAKAEASRTDCAEGYTAAQQDGEFLCLAPNFQPENCYSEAEQTHYKLVDCAAPEASFRVLQRIDGEADELACDPGATGFRVVAQDPKVTFCTGSPKD